ncbi:DNA polymerase, partial [bacterium]
MIRALVTDLNGSFAAMEQHHNPELRGRAIAVCPVLAPNGCVVASSREAKRYGVKCGVLVQDAERMCPGIHLMEATPGLYVSYQKRMREVFESVLPVHLEPNIDEFRFRLIGDETHPARAREIALDMKRALREAFSPCVTMSAGIGPNFFLAKAATNLQKDDGLVIITDEEAPHALTRFPKLTDLVGISGRMQVRLNAHGIFTVEQLTSASKEKLREVWGGVVGERWWYQMRGHEIEEAKTKTSSLGHSHVLPRERRNREGVKAIAIRLLGKAAARLRHGGYWASGLSVSVSGRQSWERHRLIPETQDDRDLIPLVCE